MAMKKSLSAALLLFAASLPAIAQTSSQTNWQVSNTFHIGGEGGWDYLTVDSASHRLFVPRGTHTLAIDSVSGKTLGDIPGQKVAHGVAIVPEAGRGFITDGGGNGAIIIFDLKTYATIGKIAALPDADGIIYDPSIGRVLVVSGDGESLLTFKPTIDPATGKVDTIALGGKPEFLATDGAGKIYINLEDKDQVAVVDFKAGKVTARWPVAPGGSPVGMAIDNKTHRLFIGCRKPQKLIVMSTDNGKVISDLPIGAGVDATKVLGAQSFASCRDGSLAVASETAPGKYEIAQTVKTPTGARTMGVDPATNTIYLPTAEFETNASGRPAAKPGTFMIVVVSHP
jgi:DNA-binding beta-propeller fold protein YncE